MTKNDLYFRWSYADQKFSEAEDSLLLSFGPNWERLTHALMPLVLLQPRNFPDEDLYIRTRDLMKRATKRGPLKFNCLASWGSIEHTMRRSKRSTFEKLAREIRDIHEEIERHRGNYVG
jgi:hypothetical protein